MMHSIRSAPWILMLAFGSAASAAPGWVSTATHPSEIFSSDGESLAAAEEVAPGQAVQIAVSLKLRNRAADMGLADAKSRRRSRHPAVAHHGTKQVDMGRVHYAVCLICIEE